MKQWKVVLIAFATATTFWFFNALNKNYTTNLTYPVRFEYPENFVPVRALPETVELDVTGGGWNLLRKRALFNPRPLLIRIEKPAGLKQLYWIESLATIRDQISDLTINRVIQDTLKIQIEPLLTKKVTLVLDTISLQLKPNFRQISKAVIQPSEITIKGPKSYIDTLKSSYKIVLEEQGIGENFNKSVTIQTPKPNLVSTSPTEVNVAFDVDRFDRLQIEVPIRPLNFPADSSRYLADQNVTIYFTVQRALSKEYVKKLFLVEADLRQVSRRDSVISPILKQYPPELLEVRMEPNRVKIIRK